MTRHYLTTSEFAERVGLSVKTIESYGPKNLLPRPDALTGNVRGWLPSTVDKWNENRLGRGFRSDLAPRKGKPARAAGATRRARPAPKEGSE